MNHDRIKRYDADRSEFNKRLPRINAGEDAAVSEVQDKKSNGKKHTRAENRPVEIVRIYRVKGKKHYKVRYTDGRIYDCDWVNKPLIDHYDRKTKSARTKTNDRRNMRRR